MEFSADTFINPADKNDEYLAFKYSGRIIFLLTNDTNENFLARIESVGTMNQVLFFRAVDTKGKDIDIPRFVESTDDTFWN